MNRIENGVSLAKEPACARVPPRAWAAPVARVCAHYMSMGRATWVVSVCCACAHAMRGSGPRLSLTGHAMDFGFSFSSELVKVYSIHFLADLWKMIVNVVDVQK